MIRLDNMTVKTSWSLVLLAFSLIILLIGGLSIYTSHQSRQSFETLNRAHVEQAGTLQRTYINLLQAQVAMDRAAELIRVPSFDEPEPVLAQASRFMEAAERRYDEFLAMTPEGEADETLAPLSDAMDRLMNVGLRLQLVLLREGDFAGYRSGRSRLNEMSQAFITAADGFLADSRAAAGALVSGFDAMAQRLDGAMAAAVVVALVMVGAVLWGITVNVIRPLRAVVEHVDRIADGDLSADIPPRGGNEIGRLYAGMARMQRSLASIVGQVRTSSERIQDAAAETTRSNTDLSTRFEQLSASLVETSASMEQLTATVKDNDDHARQANRLAGDAGGVAARGGEVVAQVAATMGQIETRSRRIEQIVGSIEGIAFQTNILALNASVEAARAGEHGSGFAVVADEVRQLAQNSDRLAKEIRALIAASSAEVARGSEQATQAGATMDEIVAAVERVSAIMARISGASAEQTRGIEQIGLAVSQMDRVTQQNVTLVAAAAHRAGTLEDHAGLLRREVSEFTLHGDRSDALSPAAPEAPDYEGDPVPAV